MSSASLIVQKPGPLTTLQDLGRSGFFRHGLTVGGAADRLAFLWANRLCGNRANTPALEVVIGGLVAEVSDYCQVAVTAGSGGVLINGREAKDWASHNLHPGDRVEIKPLNRGMRSYLAVRGGFNVAPAFNSHSTVVRENSGGFEGRALKTGDLLPLLSARDEPCFFLPDDKQPWATTCRSNNRINNTTEIRLVPGWQYQLLARATRSDLFRKHFTISSASDRMGLRLEGEPLDEIDTLPATMISEGIVAGAVQLPPDGLPIIMMPDHQTIGGYPKAGTVISCDLWKISQLRPGSIIHFRPVSLTVAQLIYKRLMRDYESTEPLHT